MSAWQRNMVVTWMDGLQEVYPFTHQDVHEGELHLWIEKGVPGAKTWRDQERFIPLANVRIRVVTS